jgi:hypothetical protein
MADFTGLGDVELNDTGLADAEVIDGGMFDPDFIQPATTASGLTAAQEMGIFSQQLSGAMVGQIWY